MATRRIGNLNVNFTPTQNQTQLYNMLGRDAGLNYGMQPQENFWDNPIGNAINGFGNNIANRARAAENAIGTTIAAPISFIDTARENANIDERNARHAKSLEDIYRNSGYNSSSDFWNAKNAAEQELFKKYGFDIDDYWNKREQLWNPDGGNSEELAKLDASREAIKSLMNDEERNRINRFDEIENQLRGQTAANADENRTAANNWRDYMQNSYVGKKINQDRGKFLGDAMTTVSTGADIAAMGMGLPMGIAANAIQGGVEGLANELSTNGFENFDWGRAGQNIASGALAGAATAGLNKVLPGAKQGGLIKSVATGAGRGALSGAVGAGVTSALSGQDIGTGLQNVLAGAGQGAVSGGVSGGIMGGVNNLGGRAINAIDRKFGTNLGEISQTGAKWQNSGENFNERLTNTLNSGESAVGNWINGKQSKTLNALGNVGNRIQNVNDQRVYNVTGKDEQYTFASNDEAPRNIKQAALDYAYETDGRVDPSELTEFYNAAQKFEGDIHSLAEQYSMETDGRVDPNEYVDFMMQSNKTGNNTRSANIGDRQSIVNYLEADAEGIPQSAPAYRAGDAFNEAVADLRQNYSDTELAQLLRTTNNGKVKSVINAALEQDSPTTASGWLKKAARRVGEDLSNKGVGLSIKGVNEDDYLARKRQTFDKRTTNDGKTSGPERTANAFDASGNQKVIANKNGVDFSIGDFGNDAFSRKSGQVDRIALSDIPDVINSATKAYNSGDSGFRKDNVAWIGETADGQKAVVYTRRNNLGQEEVINGHYIKKVPTYEDTLASYGTPAQSRTGYLALEEPGAESAARSADTILPSNNANVKSNDAYSPDIASMKVNRNDMLDTAAESPETELYRQLTGGSGNGGNGTPTPTPTPTGNTGDAWDNLAREYGYNTYNDAIRAFAAANPNTPISAGAVTTWLDSNEGNYNPNRVQITQNATTPTEIQEAEIVPSKTSRETKLKYAQGKELLAQYGAVDQPMARATKAPETFQKLAEMGFTKPGDVEKISNAITGSNGAVSKLTKSVIASAKPVNTFDGETAGQTMDDFINNSIEHNMLSGTNQGKAVKRGIDAYLRSLPSHADGSITMEDSAADAFKVVQGLEARAAELEGRGGSTYHRATTEDVHQAAVLKDVANLLKDRIYSGADVKAALTPEVAQELKAFDPKNATWSKTVDDFVSSAKTAQDLRSFQKPFVRANRYIDNQYVQAATAGGRIAASAGELPAILPTTKAGIIKQVVNNVWNSNPAHRARAAAYGKLAENAAANAPQNQTTAQPATSNPQTAVYDLLNRNNTLNVIGRNIGEEMGQKALPVDNYIEQASAESSYMPPLAATTSTAGTTASALEDLANTGTTAGTSQTAISDALTGTQGNPYAGQFSSTGDDRIDLIGRAVELAMEAGDAEAFGTLYQMYNSALASAQKQASGSDLSAAQQTQLAKFDSADDAINELEALYNQAGGGKGPIAGNLQSVAGDWGWDSGARTYNQMAEGLVNQIAQAIGKTDSLNTEGEVQRALKLVPSLTDDAQTAQNKLRTLREMLAQTKANYYGAYGV